MIDRTKARQLCEDFSLARNIPRSLREQARHELYALAWSAPELFPSWTDKPLTFCPPPGWRPINHSITWHDGRLWTALRATNYVIDDRGPRMMEQSPNFSRTFLLDIDADTLKDTFLRELFLPDPVVERVPGVPAGFEDARIFARGDELHAIMVRCDQNEEGWPEQWTGRIVGDSFHGLRKLKSPDQRRPEKNWMPAVGFEDEVWFIYSCDPTLIVHATDERRKILVIPSIAADHFRGSSQIVSMPCGDIGIIHTCTIDKLWPKNLFRFVMFDGERMTRVSDAFRFPDRFEEEYLRGYQYAMGLCFHPDGKRLLISYSLGDGQSRLGVVSADEVTAALREI